MVGEHRSVLTEESLAKLKRNLRLEYDFHQFVIDRLDQQVARIKELRKPSE
jgi:hypothetical protein